MFNKNFNFIGKRKIWYAISAVLILAGVISIFVQGFNLGIDFTGGNRIQIAYTQDVEIDDIRGVVETHVISTPTIQNSDEYEFLIRTEVLTEEESAALIEELATLGDMEILESTLVGSVIGSELVSDAQLALVLALICMLIYITYRFQFFYAISAIIPLMHDILITIGIISIFQIELDSSFVAAILTILGYSINATIVIFDRIRENVDYEVKGSFKEIINLSVNQTLGRSINTVIAVLLLILALFLLGGETTKNFMFILLVGTTIGGYSSVFIAGPILGDLVGKFGDKDVPFNRKKKKSTKSNNN